MADRLRMVRRTAGRLVTLIDFSDGASVTPVRDSFKIEAPQSERSMARSRSRYGGSRQVGERAGNGAISFVVGIHHDDEADTALERWGRIATFAASYIPGSMIEWRPEGATSSTFYELMGSATTRDPGYSWAAFVGARWLTMELRWEVAPLALLPPMDFAERWNDDSIVDGDWAVTTGAATDFTIASGSLTVTGGLLTTIRRLRRDHEGYELGDGQMTVAYHTPATGTIANFTMALGMHGTTAGGYLMAYVQGAAIRLYKVTPDHTATQFTVGTITALALDTDYWLRFRIQGNDLTAEHWTAAPTPLGTPALTITHTLVGGDIATYASGKASIAWWTPLAATARIDDVGFESFTYRNVTTPTVVNLSAVPGDAPALVDLDITTSGAGAGSGGAAGTGGESYPVWALIGWASTPATPASGVAPFGIIEGSTRTSVTTWVTTNDADYRGGSGLQATASGAGTASAVWSIDPSVMAADDFAQNIGLDVYARVELDGDLVSPALQLSVYPSLTIGFGAYRYASPFGSAGKLLTKPGDVNADFRFVHLGVVSLPVDVERAQPLGLTLSATWGAGSSGVFGVDYLVIVPRGQHVRSPEGQPLDSYFPKWVESTSQTQRIIRGVDASGIIAQPPSPGSFHHGLGGAGSVEFPPGPVSAVVKLSSMVCDDPTTTLTDSEFEEHPATLHFAVQPRTYLV